MSPVRPCGPLAGEDARGVGLGAGLWNAPARTRSREERGANAIRSASGTRGITGGFSFALAPRVDRVLPTLTDHRVPGRNTRLNVSAGWHVHLDLVAARLAGITAAGPHQDRARPKGEYECRLPA